MAVGLQGLPHSSDRMRLPTCEGLRAAQELFIRVFSCYFGQRSLGVLRQ